MVSEMAIGDIERMEAEGLRPSPADVVRLNGLGLKVERNRHSAELYAMPRVAFLGDAAFHEPTVGTELWLKGLDGAFDFTNEQTCLFLRAFAMATPPENLPSVDDVPGVRAAVEAFIRERLAGFTVGQVLNAVLYALYGNLPETGEAPPPRPRGSDEDAEGPGEDGCFEVGLLRIGTALRLGSVAEMRGMTVSGLQAAIAYALEVKGGDRGRKRRHAQLMGDYYATLDEIKKRAAKSPQAKDVEDDDDDRDDVDDRPDDDHGCVHSEGHGATSGRDSGSTMEPPLEELPDAADDRDDVDGRSDDEQGLVDSEGHGGIVAHE